ncbi:multiple stress resistance protein BhsA [Klebsiella variicola]
MKTVNTLAIAAVLSSLSFASFAAVLSSLSFASFAAVEVQSTPAGQHKVGTISASAGTNLGSLEDQLAQKADEMGATSFRITSVTGPNTLHGTAVIYK